jgi:dihydrofolate reductase
MRNLVLFMHVSLDGFVAEPKGELNWVIVDDEIFEYVGQRINAADTALYGRVTYEMMQAYWPTAAQQPGASKHDIEHSRWYNQVDKVVLSRTINKMNLPNTTIINDNLVDEIRRLKQAPGGEIIIFGSPGAAHSLMAENLIDEFWLFVNPLLLGQGIPLFASSNEKTLLTLIASHKFSTGVVCLRYRLRRDDEE